MFGLAIAFVVAVVAAGCGSTRTVTANSAAAEDGTVEAGQPVPNDNYVVEEGHRLLTYLVPDDAHVTVLTKDGDSAQLGATPITVSELEQIVQGNSSLELFEPLGDGRLDQGQRGRSPHDRPAIPAVAVLAVEFRPSY